MNYDPTRALEQEIRRLPRIGQSQYLPTVRKHLANGADPNSDALLGKKSIMVMALDIQFPLTYEQRASIVPLLIDHGGNPLRHTPLFLTMVDNRDYMLGAIFTAMAKKHDKGWPCKGMDGGNILHALLGQSNLVREVGWAIQRNSDQRILKGWIEEANELGKTPLHVLWENLDSTWVSAAWELTNLMGKRGVDLDAMDGCGRSLNQAIYSRLESVDLNLVKEEYPELAAELGGWLLQHGTQVAVAGNVAGPRF